MNDTTLLHKLGWGDDFATTFAALPDAQSLIPARISVEHRTLYEVSGADGISEAVLPGTLRKRLTAAGEHVAVGDWVALLPNSTGPASIAALLPRRGAFVRKVAGERNERQIVAANVDLALLTSALDQDFNPRRLERYLAAARGGGAQPVVILTKSDVCPDPAGRIAEAAAIAGPDVPVLACSSLTGDGVADVRAMLAPGRTLVLLGSSGIGKSTLVNALLGMERQATSGLDSIGKGRHTTTRRELILLPGGAVLIDTPGMRELHLWDEEADLAATFADLDDLATHCRFSNCRHETEPGCAVRNAIGTGDLSEVRLNAYRKLLAEQSSPYEKRGTRSAQEVKIRTEGKMRNREQKAAARLERD
jgi:ribosome biogenesis GTPase